MGKLLIIDDSESRRKQLKGSIAREYAVLLAADRTEAKMLLLKHRPKVALLDLDLPTHDDSTEEAFRCLEEMIAGQHFAKIIIITVGLSIVFATQLVLAIC